MTIKRTLFCDKCMAGIDKETYDAFDGLCGDCFEETEHYECRECYDAIEREEHDDYDGLCEACHYEETYN